MTITWGDGATSTATVDSDGSFTATHQYADNGATPFTITATTAVVGHLDKPLTATTQVQVVNVVPDQLQLTATVPTQAGSADVPVDPTDRTVALSGSFTDAGPLDTHQVQITWGDGAVETKDLAAGVFTFSNVTHVYTAGSGVDQNGFLISVKVFDKDDLAQSNASGKVRFGAVVTTDVLKSYLAGAQTELATGSGIVDTIFRFTRQFVEMTIAKAKDFVQGVGDFVDKLSKLEQGVRQLMGTIQEAIPKVLKALLTDSNTFIKNMMTALQGGFQEFFGSFAVNMSTAAMSWVVSKLPDLGIEATDLPTNWSDINQVGGFFLKVMGLTVDNLMAQVTAQVGPEKLEQVLALYDKAQTWLDQGQAGLFGLVQNVTNTLSGLSNDIKAKISDALGKFQTLYNEVTIEKLYKDAEPKIMSMLQTSIGTKILSFVASLINPQVKLIQTMYTVVNVLLDNQDKILGVAQSLLSKVDLLVIPNGSQAAIIQDINGALVKASGVLMDFAGKVLKLDKLPGQVVGALNSVKGQIEKLISAVVNVVVGMAAGLADKVRAALGFGMNANEQWLKVTTFPVGASTYTLWLVYDTKLDNVTLGVSAPTVGMQAAVRWKIADAITQWKADASGAGGNPADPAMQKLIGDVETQWKIRACKRC